MLKAVITFLLPAVLSVLGASKPILTALCDQPLGVRLDMVDTTLKRSDDSFTGVNPVIIIDDAKPDVLTVVWGATKPVRDAGVPTSALEAQIISRTPTKITAVGIDDVQNGAVQLYSLYPDKGLVYFTQHRYLNTAGGVPNAVTFYAKCQFSRGR